MAPPRLELTGVTKAFGGVHALRGVDFALRPGSIHGVAGENGAGKSTLMKIIAGVHAGDGTGQSPHAPGGGGSRQVDVLLHRHRDSVQGPTSSPRVSFRSQSAAASSAAR